MESEESKSRLQERIEEATRALQETNEQLIMRCKGLAGLHEISLAMNSPGGPKYLLDLLVKEAIKLLRADSGEIYLLDEEKRELRPAVTKNWPVDLPQDMAIPLGMGIVGWVAQKGKPLTIQDTQKDPRFLQSSMEIRSEITAPLVVEGKVIGVINIESSKLNHFTKFDEEFLTMLATHAARVLQNARMYADLDRRYREVSTLYDIQQMAISTLNIDSVLNLIVQKAVEVISGKSSVIRLLSEDGNNLEIAATHNLSSDYLSKGVVLVKENEIDQEVLKGNIVYIPEVTEDPRFKYREAAEREGLHSLLGAPLMVKGSPLGAIRVYTGTKHSFTEEEKRILATFAGQAAFVIENVRLYKRLEEQHSLLRTSYEELQKTQQELIKRERLAILGEMASIIAHEVRNPLTSIRGFAQRICRKADKKTCSYTSIIIEEVDRLNRVMKELLDFAREQKPERELCRIDNIVRNAYLMAKESIVSTKIRANLHLKKNLPLISVDPSQLKQVLLNIIQNAVQAMEQEGELTLSTGTRNDKIYIEVRDTGPGILVENRAKIFEPFFTTRTYGTGLGLSLARKIIENHSGSIEIETEVGMGTTFRIVLPTRLYHELADSVETITT